eukprot:gene2462-biopygen7100
MTPILCRGAGEKAPPSNTASSTPRRGGDTAVSTRGPAGAPVTGHHYDSVTLKRSLVMFRKEFEDSTDATTNGKEPDRCLP